jgi:hypothetical protein
MSRATPEMRNFAKRLLVCEAMGRIAAKVHTSDAFDVYEKLRPQLATLLGNDGFRALLARALSLARMEVPWLRTVHVSSDGTLEGMKELDAQSYSEEVFEGRVSLLAQLLGLLVAFIGKELTLLLVLEVWPKAPLNDLELFYEDQNEKIK